MGYQREKWHSDLTYERTCYECQAIVHYTDHALDFRPWFADGYVDCPRCGTHLRHNEKYAINTPAPQNNSTSTEEALFCSQCGRKFDGDEIFCPQCGQKK